MSELATYFFYILLLLFIVLTTNFIATKRLSKTEIYDPNRLNFLYIIILSILSFVIGFRYEVGNDWLGYVVDYSSLTTSSKFSFTEQNYELGYYTLNWFFGLLNFGYQWVFFFMALISWYFYFKSVPRYIIPLFVFFLFADEYFFWGMNGVRQFAAIAIWVFSIKLIIERKFIFFLILIISASLFHSSALILIPFYFVPYDKLYNIFYWIVIYVVSIFAVFFLDLSVIYQNLDYLVISLSDDIETVSRYSRYAESGKLTAEETKLGLGFTFKLLVNFFIIVLSKDLIKENLDLKPYFVLFFIGAILFNIFYEYQLINRFNNYFLIFRPLVLSHIVYFFLVYKKERIISPSIVILYFIIYLASIYGNSNMCCPYQIQF